VPFTNCDPTSIMGSSPIDISRATYFVLEAYTEMFDEYVLARIQTAEANCCFAIHVGFPDRPPERYAEHYGSFEDGVKRLTNLKATHPDASMWLSTLELSAEIKGADVWRGIVQARASHFPNDDECPWNMFAAAIAEADAAKQAVKLPDEEDLDFDEFLFGVFEGIAANL